MHERITGKVIELHPKSKETWSRAKIKVIGRKDVWVVAQFQIEKDEQVDFLCEYNETYRSYNVVSLPFDGELANEAVAHVLVEQLANFGEAKAEEAIFAHEKLYDYIKSNPKEFAEKYGVEFSNVVSIIEVLDSNKASVALSGELRKLHYPESVVRYATKFPGTAKVAKESPYSLIKHVPGYGWKKAEEVGTKQKIPANDRNRIKAGIEYCYEEEVEKAGHTKVKSDEFLQLCSKVLTGVSKDLISEVIAEELVVLGGDWISTKTNVEYVNYISFFFLGN